MPAMKIKSIGNIFQNASIFTLLSPIFVITLCVFPISTTDPGGFEPPTTGLEGRCYIQTKPRAHNIKHMSHVEEHLYIKKIWGDKIQEYTFKRGYKPDKDQILTALKDCFSVKIVEVDGKYTLSYGAIKQMTVWANKKLFVDTKSNLGVDEKTILDTNKRFRDFLLKATGYTAKQRRDMAKKGQ